MINSACNNYAAEQVAGDYSCGGLGGGSFSCIINLIIILIVLQFLCNIINGGLSCN